MRARIFFSVPIWWIKDLGGYSVRSGDFVCPWAHPPGFTRFLLHFARPIQSNKTEQKTNRTKSNTYFAVSSIFEPIESI